MKRSRRLAAALGASVLVTFAVALTILGARWTGASAPVSTPGLPDPGAWTRVGLPVTQLIRDLAAMVTVGSLVLVAGVLPQTPEKPELVLVGTRLRVMSMAQLTAGIWMLANLSLVALVYSDAAGLPVGSPQFAQGVVMFATDFPLGRYLVWGAAISGLVAFGCTVAFRVSHAGVLAALSVLGLWPIALTGHAAGAVGHSDAVNLQMAHLLGVAVWFGGLVALVVAQRSLGPQLAVTARRYSVLAGWCLLLVAMSGLVGAGLRLPAPGAVVSAYGLVLGIKLLAVVLLALAGWTHRRWLLPQLDAGRRGAFLRLVIGEVVVLLGAAAAAVVLSRTAPPAPAGPPRPLTTAESLLGSAMPPPLTGHQWWSSWDTDTLFAPVTVLAVGWYAVSAWRLHRRGVSWSLLRSAAWVSGWTLFLWATNGAPAEYGRVLFSMHMVQHMTIATIAPALMVLGAPVTLALRTLPGRRDGSRGPREWLLAIIRSRVVRLLTHPIVATGLFVVGMVAFYYSSLFETSLRTHTGHVLMTWHFLIVGYVFADVLIGVDPGVRRPAYRLRILMIMMAFGAHALFAVSLMSSTRVLASDWFTGLGRDWGSTMLEDQRLGASMAWMTGEIPLAVMALAIVAQWVRSDRRDQRRIDRQADRDGDRELAEYNAQLARLASGRGPGSGRPTLSEDNPVRRAP